MSSLSLYIDVAEPRLYLDRQAFVLDGRDWVLKEGVSTFVDDISFTGMLKPLPLTDTWQTSGSGDYKRLSKADYQLTTPTKWVEQNRKFDGDIYLQAQGVNERVYTLEQYERNRGMFLSWFAYNTGNERFSQLHCGYVAPETHHSFRFWSDGTVEVWKGTEKRAEGSIVDRAKASPDGKAGGTGKQLANKTVDVLIIPCRGRDILIFSPTEGGGLLYTDEDIAEEESEPTITGAGSFWWHVPVGQATVQCAPVRYETSGYLLGPLVPFRYPPVSGSQPDIVSFYDVPGYGEQVTIDGSLVQADGVTPFTPDGNAAEARLRLDMGGDGTNTPVIYGASCEFTGFTALTYAADTNIDSYWKEARLDVPESPCDVRLTIPCFSPAAMEAAGVTNLRYLGNRPMAAVLGSVAVLRGSSDAPRWSEYVSDETRELVLEVRDWWKQLENHKIKEGIPLDGLRFDVAITALVTMAGINPASCDVETSDFYLPTVGGSSQGDWANLPEVGSSPAEWVQKLFETYAGNWVYGFYPTAAGVAFRARSPWSLGITPVRTLYGDDSTVQEIGSDVFRSFEETVLEPEANDIWVTGRNPRTGRPIQAHFADVTSMDPTLAPGARPANWLGEIRRYGLVDPGITTQAAADWSAMTLALRLGFPRQLAEWESTFLLKGDGSPVWRGDNVYLYGYGVYRVVSISGSFDFEPVTVQPFRNFRYVGERVA